MSTLVLAATYQNILQTKFQKKKYSSITKLFNFENCVILAQIRLNLKFSNLEIFEIFDTADQSWLSGLSNDVSIIFQFWLPTELYQIFQC